MGGLPAAAPNAERRRLELRVAYGCDCDGVERAGPVEGSPLVGELAAIEAATGERPLTCPWRAFAEPDVGATLRAHDFWGSLSDWWGPDPEAWRVEAVRFYHTQIEAARADVIEILRTPTGAPSVEPPLGGRVTHHVKG